MTPTRPSRRVASAPTVPLRFHGLTSTTREFFEALEAKPCPSGWPGEDRVAYAAHVLSPLKNLVVDLGVLLADISPRVAFEPRVGRSLHGSGNPDPTPGRCPVTTIRGWDAASTPDHSPLLLARLTSRGLEVGLTSAGADPTAVHRTIAAIGSPGGDLHDRSAELEARGWRVEESTGPGPSSPSGCAECDARAEAGELSVTCLLAWDDWLDEPGLAPEIADLFREVLPFFDALRSARAGVVPDRGAA